MKESSKFGFTLLTPDAGKCLVRNGTKIPLREVLLSLHDRVDNYIEIENDIFNYKDIADIPITSDMDLVNVKSLMIQRSKYNLQEYLRTHKVASDAKGGITKYYSATLEKQSLLANQMVLAQLIGNHIRWNASGEECEEWSVDEMKQLAKDIQAFVTPLISKQQKMEKEITNAKTVDGCLAIEITFE